jgi:carboxylesterase type B
LVDGGAIFRGIPFARPPLGTVQSSITRRGVVLVSIQYRLAAFGFSVSSRG